MTDYPRYLYSMYEGTYVLAQSKINGHKYWIHEDSNRFIYYGTQKRWTVGWSLGKKIGHFYNTDATAVCPHMGNWNYWYWEYKTWITPKPNTNEIFLASGSIKTIQHPFGCYRV